MREAGPAPGDRRGQDGMPEVEVLLGTYNGERFLREQVDSILGQSYPRVRVTARDDGSRDGTVAILEEYERRYPGSFRVERGGAPTGGAKGNFLELMRASTAEYVCFADQDDVWAAEKVQLCVEAMRAMEARHGRGMPMLVFTDLEVVDEGMQVLHESFWAQQGIEPERIGRLPCLLQQNVVTGCTAMLNRPLLRLSLRMPEEAFLHDRWIALLASCFGRATSLPERTVMYRQHGGNVVGAGEARTGRLPRWRDHRRRRAQWEQSQRQAAGLLRVHGAELTDEQRRTVELFLEAGRRRSRVGRVMAMLRGGFFLTGLKRNLDMLWYLWEMKTGERSGGEG